MVNRHFVSKQRIEFSETLFSIETTHLFDSLLGGIGA